jgi:flavodoxin
MKVIVIYDTRFRNKETIAKALDTGLGRVRSVQTTCMNASDMIDAAWLKEFDLLCFGAPTEGFSASRSMKRFSIN